MRVGKGLVVVAVAGMPEETLSQNYSCVDCGAGLTEITPRLFSFNSPYGACSTCSGLGTLRRIDEGKLIADENASIEGGALAPWKSGAKTSWRLRIIRTVGESMGFTLKTPWKKLSKEARARSSCSATRARSWSFRSQGKRSSYTWKGSYEGVRPMLERRYRETESAHVRNEIEKYMSVRRCPTCKGRRLRKEALAVRVGDLAIDKLTSISVGELRGIVDEAGPHRQGAADLREDPPGDRSIDSGLPRGCRCRLSDPRSVLGDPFGRRESAYPSGDPDRFAS